MSQAPENLSFGRLPDGRDVRALTIGTAPGAVVDVLTRGATVHRVEVECGDGVRRNVVLGNAGVDEAVASVDYLGSTVGRYANRIAAGRFELDGRTVVLDTNDQGHSMHGGPDGFDQRLWEIREHTEDEVVLALTSPAGDQGFPGSVTAHVTYRVEGSTVLVEMAATTDATTVVNMTNHAYFNLDGDGAGTIEGHVLELAAEQYTPVDDTGIPVGGHSPVSGTPFDFRAPAELGAALRAEHPQLAAAGGIDHNVVIDGEGLRFCAALESPHTRTRLELHSDQPGLQVYTGNTLGGGGQPAGRGHPPRSGVALEPQRFPDSPNHPEWPSATLRPGEEYRSRLEWRFAPARP